MKLRIINILAAFLLSFNMVSAEETHQWRWILFNVPTQNLAFQIKTSKIYPQTAFSNGETWNGEISPVYVPTTGFDAAGEWYSNNCSVATYEFALKITDKSKGSRIKPEDKSDPARSISPEAPTKYTFSVYNLVDKKYEQSHEGYLTEEDFMNLLNMLLKDVNGLAKMRAASINKERATEYSSYLVKKIAQLPKKDSVSK